MEAGDQRTASVVDGRLKTPRAAAVAGIIFSVLLSTTLVMLKLSAPLTVSVTQVGPEVHIVVLALHLVPFAGVAFLWFIGVVRDRIGVYEDRFFATVFFGSGLLFLAMFFAAGAIAGATFLAMSTGHSDMISSGTYYVTRSVANRIMNVFGLKMAGVFMISTTTMGIRTGVFPRWLSLLGYGLAVFILLGSHFVDWLSLTFPLWVFILSVYILIENLCIPRSHA